MEDVEMLGFISNLMTLPPLPRPQLLAQTSAVAGGQRGGHTVARARDVFASTLGASHAADIGALTKAAGNARAGASLLQVADLGLDAIAAALTTMKALATQASSTTTPLSRGEQAILNAEFQDLRAEIDRIADETEFDGIEVLKGGQLTFKIGTGSASQDSVTITLPAAAAANLDAGLASDDLTANSGASQALTNVTNAISALDQLQASLEGSLVGFLGAAQNLTLSESVLTNLRTDLLDKPATFETAELLAHTVSKEILKPAAPAIAGRVSAAMGALLSSARLQPLEPAQAPVQALVPEKTEDQVAPGPLASRAGHDTESPSRREPYQSVDVEI